MRPYSVLPASTIGGMLWWLPRLAFTLFVAAVIALLWYSEKADEEERRATLISDMLWLEQNLRFLLNHNEELLGRMDSVRIEEQEVFDAYARSLLANNTGLTQIVWVDAANAVRHAHPPTIEGVTIGEGPPIPSPSLLKLAQSLGLATYGHAYPIIKDDWQFEVHVPIFRSGTFAGTAVGIYSTRRLLEDSVPWWLAERYRIGIYDQATGNALSVRTKAGDVMPPSHEYQIAFDPPGHDLVLRATPFLTPTPLAGRLISATLVVLAILVLGSLWALRRHVQGRLAAENALQTEVAFRKAMEDSVQTGLRSRNLEGRITYVNPAFCRMVGYSAEELVGHMPPMPYWAEEYIDETRYMHDLVMAGQAPSEGFEIKLKRSNGEIFDALIHEAPLIDHQGRHTGWMGSVVDITERKQAAELSRQQEARLQQSARLVTMGEMASSLAHELNQPLSAISSYIAGCRNLIHTGTTCDEIDGALGKCQEQAQRAGRIIRRIYEFVRRHEPKSEDCDIEALLLDLITLIEADAHRQKVRIQRSIAPGLPIIRADRILLGQAVLNLMKNGIEAMRQTPETDRVLGIVAQCDATQIEIVIGDRGSGIPPADAQQLFQPFFTTKTEGLGVGLNICRSVVEAHHGRLWHEPNPEGGCLFHITLPIRQPQEHA